MVSTYKKTFWRMFKRHITRLVSIILMVLVSIGFISGIFSAKDKMDSSLAEYHDAQKVSDIVLLSESGNFSADDVSLLQTRYGAENVLTGGMLEFEVKEGKAKIDDTELTFTGVPDGVVRVYLFECDSPEELAQNTLTETETYEVSSDGILVYAERSTVQLPSYDAGQKFSMETVIESTQTIEQETPFGSFEIEADVALAVKQDYVLKGTLFNGNKGEELANNFLIDKGYKIIDRNFRAANGEIDIIAKDEKEIVFVEVKTRRNMLYGEAIDAITPIKKKHILNTAKFYLYKNNLKKVPIRFDIIEVYVYKKNQNINHIKNVNLE